MNTAPLPENEKERLDTLRGYAVLDTAPEKAFDDLTSLAAVVCGTPIALISLVDTHRQWFKSKIGVKASETSREIAFCAHGILEKDLFIVPDARADSRFTDNPLVTSDPPVRFYAGVPLVTSDGYTLGMLCVNDRVPRCLTPEQIQGLKILGRQVVSQLELRRQVAELARAIMERDQSEKKLHQSEKMAALGQLASGVAHEINNPLGVILGFSEGVLRRSQEGDSLFVPLQSIHREALRCKNLVQDLLTFSRASKTERGPLNLNHAVEGALSLILAKARMTQVTVHKDLAPDLPSLLGNSNQIQQVMINLATNAIDAMKGRGTLTIKTEILTEGPLSWICLRVTDTGSGIPQEVLPHIFEPYYTTKPQGQGTGLGLALIHEIVVKHSALIDVESRPGRTEFRLRFPVRTGREGLEDVAAPERNANYAS